MSIRQVMVGGKEHIRLLPTAVGKLHKPLKFTILGCVRSKPARLISLWNFSILILYSLCYEKTTVMQFNIDMLPLIFYGVVCSVIAVFAPVAGLLTDVKFSRYKALLCSSYCVLLQGLFFLLLGTAFVVEVYFTHARNDLIKNPFMITGTAFAVILLVTLVVFLINGLQFGMDQLHDSPTEDTILYIHWYVWIQYAGIFVSQVTLNLIFYDSHDVGYIDSMRVSGFTLAATLLLVVILFLIASLSIVQSKKKWFHIEPAGFNPYKLVYQVIRFAYRHKAPLKRSAFTYTGEEFPLRIDFGKQKYGGPFTTREVEDVKSFWGILKVLICMGPVFLLQTVTQTIILAFSRHSIQYFSHTLKNHTEVVREAHIEGVARHILVSNGLLSPLLVVVCIPLYLFLIRPQIKFHIPGMLKRIGLAILLMILSLLCALSMDVIVHHKSNVGCMLSAYIEILNTTIYSTNINAVSSLPLYMNIYFLAAEHVTSALVNMLIDVAILEFICSQSPYSMKGLLLGSFFSIRSLFQGIAFLSIIPFSPSWKRASLSCGSAFYIMTIIIGVLELCVFTCVSKKYQYRTVNEPSNEYRFAEEYYSNIQ